MGHEETFLACLHMLSNLVFGVELLIRLRQDKEVDQQSAG